MLKVENISTGYGKKQVIFNVSFEVRQGEIVLLAGSNGSGKSTLLKAIYGMLPLWNNIISSGAKQSLTKGEICFNGENITGMPSSSLLKKGLLYIPQKDNLFENLTVKENLEMAGLTISNKNVLKERIDQALTNFNSLVSHLKKIPMKLSGGERKLLILAMATVHEPKMIMIDEPFTGLSNNNIKFIADVIKKLNEDLQMTFLIVEHKVKESLPIANKIIALKLGDIINDIIIDKQFEISDLHNVFV